MTILVFVVVAVVSLAVGWWVREWELRQERSPRVVERSVVRRVAPPVDAEAEGWVS